MAENHNSLNEDVKRESSAYPYTALTSALRISDAVKERGGARSAVPKSAVASHLGEPEKGQSFLQRITSAKAFGLIDGRSDYTLTETAKRIYFPTSESDKSNALLECLSTPSTFRELIKRFDGDRLPNKDIIANILHRELQVPESWKDRAAAFFINSAQHVGAIDGNGFLRFRATHHNTAMRSVAVHAIDPRKGLTLFAAQKSSSDVAPSELSDQEEQSLYLDKEKSRKFTINSPLFISRSEYQRICKWIEVTLIIENEEDKP